MARPRTFDEARALDGAMRLFWEKGYDAASTEDLCKATGLGRSSIYNTFSSKHALFVRALTHYLGFMSDNQECILGESDRPPMDRLRALFDVIVDTEEANRRDGRAIGCLGVNAAVELAGRDPDVAALLQRDLDRRLAALRDTIAAGQGAGEISRRRDAETYARFVNAAIGGMRVSAQNGADRAVLEGVAATALDALLP